MIRFKIDQETTMLLDKLTQLYNFKADTVTMRIAVAISLSTGNIFENDLVLPVQNGREYTPTNNIFGRFVNDEDNFKIYLSLFNQHYQQNLTNSDFIYFYKLHLSEGLKIWSTAVQNRQTVAGGHIDYLSALFSKGLMKKPTLIKTASNKKNMVEEFDDLLTFALGELEDGTSINIPLNDVKVFDNRNIAIAGMAGSGKTQLIKDVLYQISNHTNNKLKFIFFDYKGEGDASSLGTFLSATQCEFVDIIQNGGVDFNPLQAIDLEASSKPFSIKAFVETIATFTPNIGIAQKSILRDVLVELLDEDNGYPDISALSEKLEEYYQENKRKPDTLLAGIKDLSMNIFNCNASATSVLDKSLYLNLPPALSDSLRQLIVFLILRYFVGYFSSTNDCVPKNGIFPLRHVIVIDEAHIYLKNKNASKALEEMLRLLRSKGIVIIMLSQGVEDYKTKDFDFVSQVKIPICLNIQNKDYKAIEQYLGTPRSQDKLEEAIEHLNAGMGIIHLNEPEVFTLRQWWKTESTL